MLPKHLLFAASGLATAVTAGLLPPLPGLPHGHNSPGLACPGNTASDRATWCNYNVDTDYYNVIPDTGVTREYWFDIQDVTVAPDGFSRPAYAVNGTIPGPTIIADWGDTVTVHVTNSMIESKNGTTIHFHGIRQYLSNPSDGVASITECPLTPGHTKTYKWRATQYGSSWYHSHVGVQAWDGVFGGILINGPATSNYDEDKGILFLNDWGHKTAGSQWVGAETEGSPNLKNGLINGTNIYNDTTTPNVITGHRFNTSFTAGTSYRFRIVNAAINTQFKFSIDNHTLTVIANDLVPIVPYNTSVLSVSIGQRYDVIVTADQAHVADNFWMRATPMMFCSSIDTLDVKGIVYYGSTPSTPNTTAYPYVDNCLDESISDLVPYLAQNAGSAYWTELEETTKGLNSDNYIRWYLNNNTMQVAWKDPILLQVYENAKSFRNSDALIELPEANKWAYIVIETAMDTPHPIHLHGHDFVILAQGHGTYNSSDVKSLINPPRRDVATLPAYGHLALAFQTDNPGIWLLHCHIGWHAAEGLALQFLERKSEIRGLFEHDDYSTLRSNCASWSAYEKDEDVWESDSGI